MERQVGERLPDRLVWQLRYLLHHRRWPNLDQPKDFNEKVIWRALYDRRPIFVTAADNYASKQMALERCPSVRVPETLWKGRDVTELTDLDLPGRWVLKPNNSCGLVIEGNCSLSSDEARSIAERTRDWLNGPLDPETAWRWPWAYSQVRPRFLVEEFVGEELGQLDFRGFVIGGELRAILITWRVTEFPHGECSFYDSEFNLLPVSRIEKPIALSRPVEPIAGFREAVEEVAAATGLDSLRVDLFHSGGEFWFGETTVYPLDGLVQYWPRSFDFELGAYWPHQERLHDSAKAVKA
ncbi:MAG: ATP-grasp fold amidoligase family protein [bacterium]